MISILLFAYSVAYLVRDVRWDFSMSWFDVLGLMSLLFLFTWMRSRLVDKNISSLDSSDSISNLL